MNKLTRASIASAAAVALLLGGASTLASWNDSANIAAGTISAGNLDISSADNGTWTANGSPVDINNYLVIPGTTLTYTKTVNVIANGDNLTARLSIDPSSVAGVTNSAADQALAALLLAGLQSGAVTSDAPAGEFTPNPDGTFTIHAADGRFNHTVTLTASATIPNGAAGAENLAKTGKVNLNNIKVLLTQI